MTDVRMRPLLLCSWCHPNTAKCVDDSGRSYSFRTIQFPFSSLQRTSRGRDQRGNSVNKVGMNVFPSHEKLQKVSSLSLSNFIWIPLIISNGDSKMKSDPAINDSQNFWLAYLNYPAISEANLKELESGLKAMHQNCSYFNPAKPT